MKPNCQCNYCKTPLYRKPSYLKKYAKVHCNRNCESKARFSGQTVICSYCSKKVYKAKSQILRSIKMFCSKTCNTAFKNRQNSSGITVTPFIKIQVLEIHGLTCVNKECLLVLKGIPFEKYFIDIDHIDGNRQNNALSNLRPLCVLCHALKTREGIVIESK